MIEDDGLECHCLPPGGSVSAARADIADYKLTPDKKCFAALPFLKRAA